MKESLVWLLILVFTEPGASAPTVKITVTRSQLACEETRIAVQKGAAVARLARLPRDGRKISGKQP